MHVQCFKSMKRKNKTADSCNQFNYSEKPKDIRHYSVEQ